MVNVKSINPNIAQLEDQAAIADENHSQANAMQDDIQSTLNQISEFRLENDEWLTESQVAEMNRIETMLKAESTAIEYYGAENGFTPIDQSGDWQLPRNLEPLWNGVPADTIHPLDADQEYLSSDPFYGDYQGSFSIINSGNPNQPTRIAFQMTDDMHELHATQHGRDIIITASYDGSRPNQSWIIQDGAVRPEPFIVSALNLSHPVMIDLSGIHRQGKNYIHGSEFDDIIKGSQGQDKIIGFAGKDIIDAGAGNDIVYGDEYYASAGQFDSAYGGNDTILGGMGDDAIFTGGGEDTVFESDQGESIAEQEHWQDNTSGTRPPSGGDWLNAVHWDFAPDASNDNMLTYRNTDGQNAGQLTINMAELGDYDMAYGERDANNNLIITLSGDDGMFKIKIEDFFGNHFSDDNPINRIARLNIIGSNDSDMIDFSSIQVDSQVINISGGAGDDIIFGAKNQMIAQGLRTNRNELLASQTSSSQLNNFVNSGIFTTDDNHNYEENSQTDWMGYHSQVHGRQIVVRMDENPETDLISLKSPEGYNSGYITQSGNHMYVILAKDPDIPGQKAETIVICIENAVSKGIGYSDILVRNETTMTVGDGNAQGVTYSNEFTLTEISLDDADYLMDGGTGSDLIYADDGARVTDSTDEIIRQRISMTANPIPFESHSNENNTPAESNDSESDEE